MYDIETKCIHLEEKGETCDKSGAISFPIYQTATYAHLGLGKSTGYDYSRLQNPTREQVEKIVANLEGGIDAVAFSSGMAAISALMEIFEPGDEIIVDEDLYGGSVRLFANINAKNGIKTVAIDINKENVEDYITENTKAIYFETPTNPMMNVIDIRKMAAIAKKHHLLLVVDNTFLSPYFQNPLKLGADVVIHSGTKYLGGHNDTLAGFVVSSNAKVAEKRGRPKDILPFWVADMDFQTSSYIIEALEQMSRHGIYGYSETKEEYFEIVQNWMKKRHNWNVEEEWLIKTPGIVYALAMAVKAYTKKGEAVLIQDPVYYPFHEVVEDNDRKLVVNELKQAEDGSYIVDFEDFEQKIVENRVKLFLLCSPHNPVGRVWTKEELEKIGDICLRYNVIVVSDEIHADFVFKGKHTVFTNVKKEFEEIGVVCTSPSKSFNIAGLQVSNIFIANKELRRAFQKQVNASGYSQLNLSGLIACEAAYQYGEEWLDALLQYLKANAQYTKEYLEKYLPKVVMTELEGTYLVWLDFKAYGLSERELNKKIIQEAGLWLDRGGMFGKVGEGFQRINIACPRSVLKEALDRLRDTFNI